MLGAKWILGADQRWPLKRSSWGQRIEQAEKSVPPGYPSGLLFSVWGQTCGQKITAHDRKVKSSRNDGLRRIIKGFHRYKSADFYGVLLALIHAKIGQWVQCDALSFSEMEAVCVDDICTNSVVLDKWPMPWYAWIAYWFKFDGGEYLQGQAMRWIHKNCWAAMVIHQKNSGSWISG